MLTTAAPFLAAESTIGRGCCTLCASGEAGQRFLANRRRELLRFASVPAEPAGERQTAVGGGNDRFAVEPEAKRRRTFDRNNAYTVEFEVWNRN